MVIFGKRTMFVVTVGVWLAAAGSAAALTYNLSRRVDLPVQGSRLVTPRGAAASSLVSFANFGEGQAAQQVLYIPTITVAAPWPDRPTVAPTPIAQTISEMRSNVPAGL